jgi:hypothetical protein
VAKEVIVVMCDCHTKEQMESQIAHAFAERGISKRRTRLGWDVICRVGDPRDVQDLQRVGAQHARAVVVQAKPDLEKSRGMAIRTLMALRFVLYTCQSKPAWDDLRVVVELNQPSKVVATAAFTAPNNDTVVFPQDLSVFLRGLLFACLGQPGLAQVQMELMSFEGAAMKFRKASALGMAQCRVSEAALLWEDAVFLGVQPAAMGRARASGAGERISERTESGLLQDPDYEIQPDDTVIFLCAASMPKPARVQAETLGTTLEDSDLLLQGQKRASVGELRVLICGWRPEWDEPETLLTMLQELAQDVSTSMLVHFACRRDEARFGRLMAGVLEMSEGSMAQSRSVQLDFGRAAEESETGEPAWILNGQCTITHSQWEDDVFEDLDDVVTKRHYNEAIIIAPPVVENGAEVERDPSSKDTWLICVMLMLRRLQKEHDQEPMHVIAENALDATAKLAITPAETKDGLQRVPDFVNTQAIKARALCQVLAYPEMGEVLTDLYSKAKGSPFMVLVCAGTFQLIGREMTFAQTTRHVLAFQPKDGLASDVILGIRSAAKDDREMMPPNQSDRHLFRPGDTLIIITRRATSPEKYDWLIKRVKDLS